MREIEERDRGRKDGWVFRVRMVSVMIYEGLHLTFLGRFYKKFLKKVTRKSDGDVDDVVTEKG